MDAGVWAFDPGNFPSLVPDGVAPFRTGMQYGNFLDAQLLLEEQLVARKVFTHTVLICSWTSRFFRLSLNANSNSILQYAHITWLFFALY